MTTYVEIWILQLFYFSTVFTINNFPGGNFLNLHTVDTYASKIAKICVL